MLPTERALDWKTIKFMVDPPVSHAFSVVFCRTSFTGLWSGPWLELNIANTACGFLFRLTLLFLVMHYDSFLNSRKQLCGFGRDSNTTLYFKLLTIYRYLLKLLESLTLFTFFFVGLFLLKRHPFLAFC